MLSEGAVASSSLNSTLNTSRQNSPSNLEIFLSSCPLNLKIWVFFLIGFKCFDWEKNNSEVILDSSPLLLFLFPSEATGTSQKPEQSPCSSPLCLGAHEVSLKPKMGREKPIPVLANLAGLFWISEAQLLSLSMMREIHVYHVCSLSSQNWKQQEFGFFFFLFNMLCHILCSVLDHRDYRIIPLPNFQSSSHVW